MPVTILGDPYTRVSLIDPGTGSSIAPGSSGSASTAPVSTVQMTNITPATTLAGAAAAVAAGATKATLVPQTQGIYLDPAGGTPSSSLGLPVPVGSGTNLYGSEITTAKVVQQTAGAVLNVYYSK